MNKIHPTAIIYPNVDIGDNNTIEEYAIIGKKGHIRNNKDNNGKVKIGNGNVIGANTIIHSGSYGVTKIGNGNLIMDFVNIGHNCEIGNNTEIGACCAISGYVNIQDGVKVKIHSALRNRITIGEKTTIGMGSVVVKDCESHSVYYGNPAIKQ